MANTEERSNSTVKFLAALLSVFLHEWQTVLELGMRIVARLTRERPPGLFEVLDYDSTLELKDTQGRRAVFRRRMKVRFLQDHTIAFQDHAWGDGEILADYEISPGVVVDQYQESDRWNLLISLRGTKN